MWLDLAALGILAVAVLAGALRGTLVSSVRLGGALGAYVGAWWLAPRLAPAVEGATGFGGALGVAAAGFVAFLGLLLGAEIAAAAAKALDRRRRAGADRTPGDRAGGALVSALAGFAFAVLVGWLGLTLDALRLHTEDARLPGTEGSRFAPVVRTVVRGVGEWVLADRGPAGRAAARAASDPAETLARAERLVENPHLVGLKDDRTFWEQVRQGRYANAVARSSFLALAYDGTTRRELAELGLIDDEAARSSQAFRDASLEALAAVGPRLRALQEDPALARLAQDPDVQDMVMANDTLGLLRHPDVRQVIARALADPSV